MRHPDLLGSKCSPSSDDNVTSGETLRLVFSTTVTLDSLVFRDEDHYLAGHANSDFGGNDMASVQVGGGGGFTEYSLPQRLRTNTTS